MPDEVGVPAGDRIWRPSRFYRVSLIGLLAPFAAIGAALVWITLPTGQLPGWWFLALAVPLWGWLGFRAWTLWATLTPDALVFQNLLTTGRIAVADITKVDFPSPSRGQWSTLRVTDQAKTYLVWAIARSVTAADRGERGPADEAADAICAAAGLPPVPAHTGFVLNALFGVLDRYYARRRSRSTRQ